MNNLEQIDWAKGDGLVPAIVQDASDGRVLMLGYMNAEALRQTAESGKVTFFSRSKQRLWVKGETSGNFLEFKSVQVDCDGDTLLVKAIPCGPVCHNGTATCFGYNEATPLSFLHQLEEIIDARAKANPAQSYTARLFGEGIDRIAQKVGEEGVEVALAAVGGSKDKLREESADLIFHLLVALRKSGLSLAEVVGVLQERHKKAE